MPIEEVVWLRLVHFFLWVVIRVVFWVFEFYVLGSGVCVCVCFPYCDRCLKEEVGMAKIGGDWWVSQ